MTNESLSCVRADALTTGGIVAAALLIEHLLLYRESSDEIGALVRYTAGMATIGAGLTALELRRGGGGGVGVMEFWVIVLCGGAATAAAHLTRRWLREQRRGWMENGKLAAFARGDGYRTWHDRIGASSKR